MMKNKFVQFICTMQIRFFIILFWIFALIGFVYLSYLTQYFAPKRSLSIYMWADKVDESILQKFEKETGIKIYANYYESNEELVTKFEIAKDLNCDVILLSEYIVQPLAGAGFLKKIDKSKCDFIDRVYPQFLGKSFDFGNDYSLPIYWDMLGFGYTKSYFENGLPKNSWSLVFDQELVPCKQISMVDDSREAIFLAAQYNNWSLKKLGTDQLKQIEQLFVKQKSWVGAYTDFQQGYFLASKTYPLVVSAREVIAREMLVHKDISFTVPDEGSLLSLTNVVICESSNKDDLVYQFLNYVYQHEILLHNCKEFCILPVVEDALKALPSEYIGVDNILPGQKVFDRLKIFPNILTQKEINDVWIAFKSF